MEGAEDSLVGMVVGMKRGGKSEAEGGKGGGGEEGGRGSGLSNCC